jgi:RNA polymerase-binding protein DksA
MAKTKKLKKKTTKSKFENYRQVLLQLRERLAGDIDHIKNDHLQKSQKDLTGELSGYSIHIADMSGDDYDRGVALGIFTQEQDILYLIDAALKRIEEGAFGVCEVCEKVISSKRLEAVPYATLCIQCQSDQEKKKKV